MIGNEMNTTADQTIGASEQRSCEAASKLYPVIAAHASAIVNRIRSVRPLAPDAAILDIGAAQGLFVIACRKMGYRCVGVEPWPAAREVAEQLALEFRADVEMLDGTAESLPVPSESFDLVHATSVLEHVDDVTATLQEVYRVLKPGGVFWFLTASSLCPRQGEIRGFPGFGWYPDPLKIRIMTWAKDHRPDLIAHTTRPAYHWFTPWKARRLLRQAGFRRVFDRWDLRLQDEGGSAYRMALAVARHDVLTKFVADVLVPSCSYAAIK
jgi:ubiquinone/menaquinone biosynthesis C-methylase UbiE